MRPATGGKIEASTLSKSSTSQTMDATHRNAIATGTSSVFDRIFPLLDEVLKTVQIAKPLYMILILYNTIQMLGVSFWSGFEDLHHWEGTDGQIAKWMCMLTFFTDLSGSIESLVIRFVILTILAFLLVFILVVQAIIYSNNRRFIKWTLYPTRFIIEFLPLIMLAPMGNNFGTLFDDVVHSPSTIQIVFFVFTTLYMAFIILVHYVVSMFFAVSPYVSQAPTASWSGSFYFSFTIGIPIFAMLAKVIILFNKWFVMVFVGAKVVYNIIMIWRAWYLPLVHVPINAVVMVIFTIVTGMDALTLVRIYGIMFPYWAYFAVIGGCVFLGVPTFYCITMKRVGKIKKDLQLSALEQVEGLDDEQCPNRVPGQNSMLQDPDRRALYTKYGLDRSESKCQLYTRIGIAEHSDLFLDWSLFKFAGEFHPTKTILANITQFLSLFPGESRLLNVFFIQTICQPNLSWAQRFMLYEIHRVKGLRLSSASSEITEKLMDLKRMSQAGITTIRDFWKNIPNDIGFFYDLRSTTVRTAALYAEAVDKWPNHVRLCEDYATFLIECATDYVNGIKIQHRADLIEQGKNFVVDISFRSLVRAYPMYLKRNIMDIKGNFIAQKTAGSRTGSNNSTGNSQMSTGTIDGELDVEIEEQLARQAFNQHRVRLAYQRALIGKKSPNSKKLKISAIWTLMLSLAICVFCFVFYHGRYNDRAANMNRQFNMNQYRYGYDAALASIAITWLRNLGALKDDLFNAMAGVEGTGQFSLDLTHDMIDESNHWLVFAEDALSVFMDQVSELAASGDDVFTIVRDQIQPTIYFHFAADGELLLNTSTLLSLNDAVSYNFVMMRRVVYEKEVAKWATSNELCEALANIPYMATSFDAMQASMAADQETKKNKAETLNNLILFPVAIGFFLVSEPFLLFFLVKIFKELKLMLTLMKNLDDQTKQEASKLLRKDATEEDQTEKLADTTETVGLNKAFFVILVFCPIAIFVILFVCVIQLAQSQNRSFLQLNEWMTLGVSRANLMLETVFMMSLAIAIPDPINTKIMTSETANTLALTLCTKLLDYNNHLLRGGDGVKPCIGVNEAFDTINLKATCVIDEEADDRHSVYNCLSLDRSITFFNELIAKISTVTATEKFEVDSDFYHMFHVVNNHMVEKSYEGAEILSQLAADSNSTFEQQLAALCFGGMAFMILGFMLFWKNLMKLDVAYDGALQVMRRIPPASVVSNTPLLNFLLNRSGEKNSDKMTASKLVVHVSKDAVLCLNRNESIEVVNQSVSGLFGYTPEQLLGQPISTVLPQDRAEDIFSHIDLMRLGQCSMTYETTSEGMTDDEQIVPVHVTLIGICEPNQSQAKSFVVIMRDETALQKQQKEAEEAKAQSENLLYQILPRDIVVRLKQGESDISFSVPSATIIFVDIVKFSDYSATLSPAQIMENLSTIFARFDMLCQKQNLITKIKLIGDVYMAAAGLFTPDEPVANHASQVVQFGLDVLVALDEINCQLDSSLQVRIGVNTDGPLIAGVLGTDKPVFDIIGDPINVAARLQSTCIPMTVQISQMTYEAIVGLNFNIEQRGEVELKGKGKKMAYLVRPMAAGSFFLKSDKSSESLGIPFES